MSNAYIDEFEQMSSDEKKSFLKTCDITKTLTRWGHRIKDNTLESIVVRDMYLGGKLSQDEFFKMNNEITSYLSDYLALASERNISHVQIRDAKDENERIPLLALASLDHDYSNLLAISLQIKEFSEILGEDFTREMMIKEAEIYSINKRACILASLIASGDKILSSRTDPRNIPSITRRILMKQTSGVNITYSNLERFSEIPSECYMGALIPFIANASVKFDEGKLEGLVPQNIEKKIEVGMREMKKYVCLYVRDNGPGIEKGVISKIYGTFTKNGTGIGLQIAKRVSDILGCFLQVTSKEYNDKAAVCYDTKTSIIREVENFPYGTLMEIFVPTKYIKMNINGIC